MSPSQSPRTPDRAAIREHLRDLVHEIAGVPLESIDDEATIDEQMQMNSLTFVELQVAIEDEYAIELDAVRVVELNRFASIVDYVHGLVTEAAR